MVKQKTHNTEIAIMEAAKKIFQRKGMAGARMQEIADEAGINKAMLHYYYRSKEKLFEAVFSTAINMIVPRLISIAEEDTHIFDKIRHFTKDYISFIAKHPYIPGFIINELNRNPGIIEKALNKQTQSGIRERIQRQLHDAIEKDEIRPVSMECLLTDMISLSIFPIMAEPLLSKVLQKEKTEYKEMLEKRSQHVAELIINSIKK
jgi:AcrR family transcriptional regulator